MVFVLKYLCFWYLFAINNYIDTQIARTRTSVPLQSKKMVVSIYHTINQCWKQGII